MSSADPKVADEPAFVPRPTYDAYIDRYIEAVKDIDGVLAIYQMGGVSDPGISDIDLIVVVEERFRPHAYGKLSVRRVFDDDEQAAYLFTHDVMIVDTSSFTRLEFIFYASNLRLLHGSKLSTTSPTPQQTINIKFAILCDITLMRLHQFSGARRRNILPIRGSLLRASSIKHSLRLADEFDWDGVSDSLATDVERFRSGWFEAGTPADARRLISRCEDAFRRLAFACGDHFAEDILHFREQLPPESILLLSDHDRVTLFLEQGLAEQTADEDHRLTLNRALHYLTSRPSTLVVYPQHLYFHYLTYARTADNRVGTLLEQILSCAYPLFDVNDSYFTTMQKRCRAISFHARFIQENRLHFSAGVGYPGINLRRYSLAGPTTYSGSR